MVSKTPRFKTQQKGEKKENYYHRKIKQVEETPVSLN